MQGFKPKPARAFTTTASERDREQATRDQARAAQARVETVEKYSGLRIKNRVVAGMVVEDRFNDLRFYRLKDLRHTISGRWATAGVLVEKSVKQSSNGGSYSVWKLSDLGRDDVRHRGRQGPEGAVEAGRVSRLWPMQGRSQGRKQLHDARQPEPHRVLRLPRRIRAQGVQAERQDERRGTPRAKVHGERPNGVGNKR